MASTITLAYVHVAYISVPSLTLKHYCVNTLAPGITWIQFKLDVQGSFTGPYYAVKYDSEY